MLFLEGRCPHCGEKRGLKIFSVSEYTANASVKEIEKRQTNELTFTLPSLIRHAGIFAAGYCVCCRRPLLVELKADLDYLYALREHVKHEDKLYQGPQPEILRMWPEPEEPYSHPSLPEEIRLDFVELQKMLNWGLQPHRIIGGCRQVLETSVKSLGGEGSSLYRRVENLKDKAIISGVLYDWAQQILALGNDAVHDREGTREDAVELVEFTKLFLQYTFELPARINEIRRRGQNIQSLSPHPIEKEGKTA